MNLAANSPEKDVLNGTRMLTQSACTGEYLQASAVLQSHAYQPSDRTPRNWSSEYQSIMKCNVINRSSILQGSKQWGFIFMPRNIYIMKTEVWDPEGKCLKGIRNRHHLRKHSVTKHQKDFFFVAEQAFETSRNPSESQRCLPRQRTEHWTDKAYSVLKQNQEVKAAIDLESFKHTEFKQGETFFLFLSPTQTLCWSCGMFTPGEILFGIYEPK